MKRAIATILFAAIMVLSVGCVSNIKTDRDRVASAALTYEAALDGLTTARKSGLLDDDAYRKIDPIIDTAHALLLSLKARVDEGENVSDNTLDRMDDILDSLLEILLQYGATQSRVDRVYDMKTQLAELRVA